MLYGTKRTAPGLALSFLVAGVALSIGFSQRALIGFAYVDEVVLAILVGAIIRLAWSPGTAFTNGIKFCAKTLLECAIVLLGASLSFRTLWEAGFSLLAAVLVTVLVTLVFSYTVCRAFKLSPTTSLLVASGTSICGNSAIVAVGSVIGAKHQEMTATISFTSILGVIAIIFLPLLVLLGYSERQYGILAGLTAYAVPQVLAATVPVGAVSLQIGTFVKLLRILMLGPVILGVTLVSGYRARALSKGVPDRQANFLNRLVPWFIIGFVIVASLATMNALPEQVVKTSRWMSQTLTILSMAALGLSVELKELRKVGIHLVLATFLCLLFLVCVGLVLVSLLDLH